MESQVGAEMKKNIVFAFLLFLLMPCFVFGTINTCQITSRPEEHGVFGRGKPLGPAKLFSDPVIIPAFQLRFIDGKTKKDVTPSKIRFEYGMRWLEYPYPEHSWGVWTYVRDVVECIEPGTETLIPKFIVQPRGWYDGKYVKFPFTGKRPSFTGIVIAIEVGCGNTNNKTWATLSPKESSKIKNNQLVTIEVNCTGDSTVIIK